MRKLATRKTKTRKEKIAEHKLEAMKRLKAFWTEFQNMTDDKKAVIQQAAQKLGNYSVRNQILIYLQAYSLGFEPSAVCPLSVWNKVGRYVKKGSKGLQILVPMIFKGKDAPTPDACAIVPFGHDFDIDDGSTPSRTWFKIAHVFDLSQTELREGQENTLPAIGFDDDNLLTIDV